jgi:hypothetical protein
VHPTVDLFIDVLDGANVPPLTVAAVDPDLLLAVKLEHCGIIGAGAGSHRETIRTGHDCAAIVAAEQNLDFADTRPTEVAVALRAARDLAPTAKVANVKNLFGRFAGQRGVTP